MLKCRRCTCSCVRVCLNVRMLKWVLVRGKLEARVQLNRRNARLWICSVYSVTVREYLLLPSLSSSFSRPIDFIQCTCICTDAKNFSPSPLFSPHRTEHTTHRTLRRNTSLGYSFLALNFVPFNFNFTRTKVNPKGEREKKKATSFQNFIQLAPSQLHFRFLFSLSPKLISILFHVGVWKTCVTYCLKRLSSSDFFPL